MSWLKGTRLCGLLYCHARQSAQHKHTTNTQSFYCAEEASLGWGPTAGKSSDRRRNEERMMRKSGGRRNKEKRRHRIWRGARQRGPVYQPGHEIGAGWAWARTAGMSCPPLGGLQPHGCSLPTSESPWPAAGQCASGEEISYWELWTQNNTSYNTGT